MPRGQLAVRRDHPEFLLPGEGFLSQCVPAHIEAAPVLVGPLPRNVVGRVGGARGEVHEERPVGGQCLLLSDPAEGLVGHVRHEMVTLLGRAVHLDRRGALVQTRIPLVSLATDKPVEVFETTAAAGPRVERPDRAGLPDRDFVALAELGGVVAVEL
ncbi:Uncharacterised protein [Mycobacterium tuberculosis]|nr:Uncharacterised protein [Mycobacterium tuberculosis]COW11674.1 Uncharacterised protein [Mycobacterium tuberculosis]